MQYKSVKGEKFLSLRGDTFYYRRRVPSTVAEFDSRYPVISQSLKTDNFLLAKSQRDLLVSADENFWSSVLLGDDQEAAKARYKVAVLRAKAYGFKYTPREELLNAPSSEILERLTALEGNALSRRSPINEAVIASVMGDVQEPETTLQEAADLYIDEICTHDLVKKSAKQKQKWKQKKQSTYNTFIAMVGNKPIKEVTRDDALKFYRYWKERVAPKTGVPTHSASRAKRDMGNMRLLFDCYFSYIGIHDRPNPFLKLSFNDKIGGLYRRTRPPFSFKWIQEKILSDALIRLNVDARAILLVLIDTGAREGEICNLDSTTIHLNAETPYITVQPSDDPYAPREIKTSTSIRNIPLVGLALDVFRCYPDGFKRYRGKEGAFSANTIGYLRRNKLMETDKHVLYSFRHSFEDRMKEAGLDFELREIIMGHTLPREQYGSGGSLKWQASELQKIVFDYDINTFFPEFKNLYN